MNTIRTNAEAAKAISDAMIEAAKARHDAETEAINRRGEAQAKAFLASLASCIERYGDGTDTAYSAARDVFGLARSCERDLDELRREADRATSEYQGAIFANSKAADAVEEMMNNARQAAEETGFERGKDFGQDDAYLRGFQAGQSEAAKRAVS